MGGQALGAVVSAIAGFFATWLSKKAALASAAIAVFAGLFVTFATVVAGLASSLTVTLPTWAASGVLFLPDNLPVCISALISAKLARLAYSYHVEMLKVVSYIT